MWLSVLNKFGLAIKLLGTTDMEGKNYLVTEFVEGTGNSRFPGASSGIILTSKMVAEVKGETQLLVSLGASPIDLQFLFTRDGKVILFDCEFVLEREGWLGDDKVAIDNWLDVLVGFIIKPLHSCAYRVGDERKRHIAVDALGIIHGVRVREANSSDAREAMEVIREKKEFFSTRKLEACFADSGYRPKIFLEGIKNLFGINPLLSISQIQRNYGGRDCRHLKNTNLTPKRWIVERAFAWFNHYRRLTRDYERKIKNAEAMILIAMTQLLLRRVCS